MLTLTCLTADLNTINPESICTDARYREISHGFRDMKKFIALTSRYMNVIFTEV